MRASAQKLCPLFEAPVSFRIPLFQRPYAWNEERQWQPLWGDVQRIAEQLIKEGDREDFSSHFLGAIVLQLQSANSDEVVKRIVVDGQQRLTTLQVLIRATQEAFLILGETERANRMSPLLFNDKKHQAGDLENEPKVCQSNSNDRHAFRDVIIESGDNSPTRGIGQCDQYFKTAISQWFNEPSASRVDKCEALEKVITSHLQLAVVDLDQGEKPHYIFSVLNARAEPLKESDHIKNIVMYETGVIDDAAKARELWGIFDSDEWWRKDTKEGRVSRIHLDRFLNYWVMMKVGGEVNVNRVSADFTKYFDSIRSEYASSQMAMEELARGLIRSGIIYKDLEEVRLSEIAIPLRRIKTMEAGVAMPILLWLYSAGRPQEECIRGVRALESYLVRRMLCNFSTQGLNRLFIELIRKLHNLTAGPADQAIIDFLRDQKVSNRLWPNDRMLMDNLIDWPMPGTLGRKVMVLETIELYLRSDKSESFVLGSSTLEHIMPVSWERHWPLGKNASEDERYARQSAVQEIGNFTLVSDKLNPSLSNSAWDRKVEGLSMHTTLRLNWNLLQSAPDVWNEDSIRDRSAELVDAIAQIWKSPDQL